MFILSNQIPKMCLYIISYLMLACCLELGRVVLTDTREILSKLHQYKTSKIPKETYPKMISKRTTISSKDPIAVSMQIVSQSGMIGLHLAKYSGTMSF